MPRTTPQGEFPTLHSNLVIFKSHSSITYCITVDLYIPIWLYSNRPQTLPYPRSVTLYIPIWLYSNYMEKVIDLKSNELYIPIWLYSNVNQNSDVSKNLSFTFQSGYIQIRPYHTTYLCRLKSTFLSTDK